MAGKFWFVHFAHETGSFNATRFSLWARRYQQTVKCVDCVLPALWISALQDALDGGSPHWSFRTFEERPDDRYGIALFDCGEKPNRFRLNLGAPGNQQFEDLPQDIWIWNFSKESQRASAHLR